MTQAEQQLDQILDRLVREVEASVHSLYRGDHRQNTMMIKTDGHRRAAREALLPLVGGAARATPSMPAPIATSGGTLSAEEVAAITRCIMAWSPMGVPNAASPQSRCVSAAKELAPSWGEREAARQALKRISG